MDFDKLNKEQRFAAEFCGKHALVLAGAGTGKTRTIIARAIHLINNQVRPDKIKILSFTKKSANEIVNRIRIESEGNLLANELSGSTFHSWCMELITKYPDIFGLKGYTTIDEDDRKQAFSLLLGRTYGKKKIKIDERCKVDADVLIDIYSYEVNTMCTLSDAIRAKTYIDDINENAIEEIKPIAVEIFKGYIQYKKERHYIDYDDMLMVVAKALHINPSVRQFISSQYEHILVDEAQDTNPLQWYLLENFYDNCHLFLVGDDAQSIYGFRGADFKSIHSFTERVKDSTILRLTENYRSTQEILDLSNWLLNQSPLKYEKDLVAHRGSGNKPVMYYLRPDWETAEVITNIIQKGKTEGKSLCDFLILSRSSSRCRTLEAACLQKNIPYRFFGGTALMRSAHIRDVVSSLRIIANFRDELAWTRYLLLFPGIGEVYTAKIIDQILSTGNIQEAINILKEFDKCQTLTDILSSIIGMNSTPGEAIKSSYEGLRELLSKKYDNWDYRKRDFDALISVAENCDSISKFVTEYLLDPIADYGSKVSSIPVDDAITISTIHSAKGLEADTCFILNVFGAEWPSDRAKSSDDIEEERRCLYVAMTRAKNNLYLMSIPSLQTMFNKTSIEVPSPPLKKRVQVIGRMIISKNDTSIHGLVKRRSYPVEVEKVTGNLFSPHINDDTLYTVEFKDGTKYMTAKEILEDYDVQEERIDNSQRYFLNKMPKDLVVEQFIDNAKADINQSGYGYSEIDVQNIDGAALLDDFNFD